MYCPECTKLIQVSVNAKGECCWITVEHAIKWQFVNSQSTVIMNSVVLYTTESWQTIEQSGEHVFANGVLR